MKCPKDLAFCPILHCVEVTSRDAGESVHTLYSWFTFVELFFVFLFVLLFQFFNMVSPVQDLLIKKTFWFPPPPLTDFTDMVLKLTVLVKVICNANSHDFTYWSVNRDRFVQLHFPRFTFNPDYSLNQTLAEPILRFSCQFL